MVMSAEQIKISPKLIRIIQTFVGIDKTCTHTHTQMINNISKTKAKPETTQPPKKSIVEIHVKGM